MSDNNLKFAGNRTRQVGYLEHRPWGGSVTGVDLNEPTISQMVTLSLHLQLKLDRHTYNPLDHSIIVPHSKPSPVIMDQFILLSIQPNIDLDHNFKLPLPMVHSQHLYLLSQRSLALMEQNMSLPHYLNMDLDLKLHHRYNPLVQLI